jgi:hypothetical protein
MPKVLQEGKKGFIEASDCTYKAGLAWLKENYPDAYITSSYSRRTGNHLIKVDGSLAMKEERMTQLGYKLCNEFRSEWESQQVQESQDD